MPHHSHASIVALLQKNTSLLKSTIENTLEQIESSAASPEEYTTAVIKTFSLEKDTFFTGAKLLTTLQYRSTIDKELDWRKDLHDSTPNQYQAFSSNKNCTATINKNLNALINKADSELATFLEEIVVKPIHNSSKEKFWFSVSPAQESAQYVIEILAQDKLSLEEKMQQVRDVYLSLVRALPARRPK